MTQGPGNNIRTVSAAPGSPTLITVSAKPGRTCSPVGCGIIGGLGIGGPNPTRRSPGPTSYQILLACLGGLEIGRGGGRTRRRGRRIVPAETFPQIFSGLSCLFAGDSRDFPPIRYATRYEGSAGRLAGSSRTCSDKRRRLSRSRKPREYLVPHSTTRNPYLYLGRGAQYRFASFKRSTWSSERSN